jgi:hypothetical protein
LLLLSSDEACKKRVQYQQGTGNQNECADKELAEKWALKDGQVFDFTKPTPQRHVRAAVRLAEAKKDSLALIRISG